MSYCSHSRRRSKAYAPKKAWKHNDFLMTVFRICLDEGCDPNRIVPIFKANSSADFLCGPPVICNMDQVPWSVWQRVCGHYNASTQIPYYQPTVKKQLVAFKERSDVFISSKLTEQLVHSRFLLEQFSTSRRLYQYLNWTMRISKVAQTSVPVMTVVEGQNGGRLLLINMELHNQRGHELYALCSPNDATAIRSQEWQLGALLTAYQVVSLLGIHAQCLPRGVREVSPQYAEYRRLMSNPGGVSSIAASLYRLKDRIRTIDAQRKLIRYCHLKCIQTATGNGGKSKKKRQCLDEKVLTIGLSSFYAKVRSALEGDGILVPIVSIVSRKNKVKDRKEKVEQFSVDYLLPVQVGINWIGVVFRGEECAMALLDRYDISNKAILCDPSFDVRSLDWFQNGYNRLKVVPDDELESPDEEDVVSMTLTPPPPTPPPPPTLESLSSIESATGSTSSESSVESPIVPRSATPVQSRMPLVRMLFRNDQVYRQINMQWLDPLMEHWESDKAYFEQFLMGKQ